MKRAQSTLTNPRSLKQASLAPLFPLLAAGAGCGDAYNGIALQIVSHVPKAYACILRMVNKQAARLVPVPMKSMNFGWDIFMHHLIFYDDFKIIKYCYNMFRVRLNDKRSLFKIPFCQLAANFNRVDILQWGLKHQQHWDPEQIMSTAIHNNQLSILDCCIHRGLTEKNIFNVYSMALFSTQPLKLLEFLYVKHRLRMNLWSIWELVFDIDYDQKDLVKITRWCLLHQDETMFSVKYLWENTTNCNVSMMVMELLGKIAKDSRDDRQLIETIMSDLK